MTLITCVFYSTSTISSWLLEHTSRTASRMRIWAGNWSPLFIYSGSKWTAKKPVNSAQFKQLSPQQQRPRNCFLKELHSFICLLLQGFFYKMTHSVHLEISSALSWIRFAVEHVILWCYFVRRSSAQWPKFPFIGKQKHLVFLVLLNSWNTEERYKLYNPIPSHHIPYNIM